MGKFIRRLDTSHTNQELCAVDIVAGQVLSHDLDRQNQLVPGLANGHLWRQAGIATHNALAGEMVTVVVDGSVEFEPGTFEPGYVYVTSAIMAGALVKHDDMGSVGHLSIVGYSVSDSVLEVINLQRRVPAVRQDDIAEFYPPGANYKMVMDVVDRTPPEVAEQIRKGKPKV